MAPAAAQDPPVIEAQVREAVEALDVARSWSARTCPSGAVHRAQWTGLAEIYRDVGKLADRAGRLERLADRLYREDHHDLEVSRREFRRRLVLADSLVAMARLQAAVPWDEGLPEDLEDARHLVPVRARAAKNLADRTAAAATDVAYGLGVTEGIGYRALALSVVGILVVFTVLSLIALVVGAIRQPGRRSWKAAGEGAPRRGLRPRAHRRRDHAGAGGGRRGHRPAGPVPHPQHPPADAGRPQAQPVDGPGPFRAAGIPHRRAKEALMKLKITVHGVAYEVDVEVLDAKRDEFGPAGALPQTSAHHPSAVPAPPAAAPAPAAPAAAPPPAGGGAGVRSPIAGTVVEVKCKPGDEVAQGRELLIIEAMKMNTTISSPAAGKVKDVLVAAGDSVRENQQLVDFE